MKIIIEEWDGDGAIRIWPLSAGHEWQKSAQNGRWAQQQQNDSIAAAAFESRRHHDLPSPLSCFSLEISRFPEPRLREIMAAVPAYYCSSLHLLCTFRTGFPVSRHSGGHPFRF